MKYGLIAAIIAVVALFYFMSQSNKADAERLKQAEIAHQQKLGEAQALEDKKASDKVKKGETDKMVQELQSKYMMDYLEAKKVVESPEMSVAGRKFYADLAGKWGDAFKVASSTSRVALSQPVKDMQQIKRELESRKIETACEAKLKDELLKSYDFAIDGFLNFMQQNEAISSAFINIGLDHQKNANALVDYC
ncbi:hypothetical protein [Acinetobacter sp.]|uniref:hypothetical protein n=1 Tax=Acinetobacter sp. TaxID=472 RepID=UPI002FC90A55